MLIDQPSSLVFSFDEGDFYDGLNDRYSNYLASVFFSEVFRACLKSPLALVSSSCSLCLYAIE